MKSNGDIENLLISIEQVSDLFYKQMNTEAYVKFAQVLNDIETVINEIKMLKREDSTINFDDIKVNNTLIEAMNALENQDNILLADILNYDLKQHFESIRKSI